MNDLEINQISQERLERLRREALEHGRAHSQAWDWRHTLAALLIRVAGYLEPELRPVRPSPQH